MERYAKQSSLIVYFEKEGRHNLASVLHVVKRAFKRRPEVRTRKLVIFTALGEGPALAYNKLKVYDPQIIAVTFPPNFIVTSKTEDGNSLERSPRISEKLEKFFQGVGVKVLTGRLPFDAIDGSASMTQQMQLIKDVLSIFGGSFSLCIQAILQACDMGAVKIGEQVIGVTGDCAALVTASSTKQFLSAEGGLSINEIWCKPRNLNLLRKPAREIATISGDLFEKTVPKLLPPL